MLRHRSEGADVSVPDWVPLAVDELSVDSEYSDSGRCDRSRMTPGGTDVADRLKLRGDCID